MAAQPVVVGTRPEEPPAWERALGASRRLALGPSPSAEERAALGAAGCALVDGSAPDPVELARRVRSADPALQVMIVAPPDDRAGIERQILFTPGLGEVWIVAPSEVGSALVERAADVTRTRREYPATRARLEQDFGAIEPHAARRALISDAYLAALLEALPDLVLSIDEDDRILSWNPAAERVLGYARDEVQGRPIDAAFAPLDPDVLARVLAAGREASRQAEVRFRTKTGEIRNGEITVIPVEAAGHRVRAVILHDVTERKRAEAEEHFLSEASAALATSLDYEETLARVAHLAVPALADWCIVDVVEENGRAHRVETVHRDPRQKERVEALLGYEPGPDRTRGISKVIRTGEPALIPDVSDSFLDSIAHDEEHLRVLRDLRPRSAMAVPLRARRRTLGAITFVRSDPDRRFGPDDLALAEDLARRAALAVDNARLYEITQVASQAKSEFLAVMSHELRTPLNAIIGYVDLLDAEVTGPLTEGQAKQLERIGASSRHLLRLIEQILTFSRTEAGKEEIRTERVDFAELVREAGELMGPLATEKGLEFHVRVPAQPVEMDTDPAKARQILLNLLSNAVKFTDEGEVELTAEAEDGRVVSRVRDTGVGIAPEHLKDIFEPFQQIEGMTTREVGGTGLGLSVARRLARLLGGDITVESTPGEGSTVTVRLPRTAPVAPE